MTGTRSGESVQLSRQKHQQSLVAGSGGAFILRGPITMRQTFFQELPRHGCFQVWQHCLRKTLVPNMTSHLKGVDGNTTTAGRFRVRTVDSFMKNIPSIESKIMLVRYVFRVLHK